jgi:RHS repeat-associated protein
VATGMDFNGKENDNEVKGDGNQQYYGMRIYDLRLGKFLSVDPLTMQYPHYTPYSFAGNKPIPVLHSLLFPSKKNYRILLLARLFLGVPRIIYERIVL